MAFRIIGSAPKKERFRILEPELPRGPFGRGTGMISSPAEAPASEPSFTRDVLGQTAKDVGTMAYNLPGSTYRLGKEMAGGLGNLAGSAVLPEFLETEGMKQAKAGLYEAGTHPVQTAKTIWGDIKTRYGTPEAIRETLINDPARVALDIGGTLWGGGKALQTAGQVGKFGRVAAAGEALAGAGEKLATAPFAVPIKAAEGTLKAAARSIPEGVPEKLYASAFKMPLDKKSIAATLSEGPEGLEIINARKAAARTGMEGRVLPRERTSALNPLTWGTKGLIDVITEKNNLIGAVNKAADALTAEGKAVQVGEIIEAARPHAYKFAENSSAPLKAKAAVDEVLNGFKEHGEAITPRKLHDIKKQLYRELNDNVFGKYAGIEREATKGLANASMTALEEMNPEIGLMNKKIGSYINLQRGVEKAVERLSNKDLVSLADEFAAATGSLINPVHPGTGGIIGYIGKKLIDSPTVKARLAIALKEAKAGATKKGPFGRGTPTPAPEGPVVKPNGEPTATAQAGMQSAPKSEVKGVKKYYRAVPEDRPLNETSDHWYNDTPEAAEATKASLEASTGRPHRIIEIPAEEIEKAGIKTVKKSPFNVEGNWVETERFVQPESVKGIAGEISLKDKIMNRLDTLITQEGKSTGHPQTREYLAGELAKDGITATGAEIEQAAKNIKTNGVPSTDIERGLIRVLRDEKRANRHTKKPFGRKVKSNEKMLPENIEIKNQPEDYVRAYIDQYSKGEPGINRDLIRPDNSGEIVLRDDKGKVIGVLAHDKDTITDIVIKKSERRKGNAKKLYQYANDIGIVKFKGPFSKQGLSFAEKMESARKPFGRK